MSTLAQLITHRATAGARYVAAVTELRAAFGDLSAIERVLCGSGKTLVPTFGGPQPDPIPLRHPTYLTGDYTNTANFAIVSGTFEDDVKVAFAVRSAAFGTPDAP
jgi:hypothetical protein